MVRDNYHLLNSGGALGHGVGPLLISKQMMTMDEIQGATIALPGKLTTAHLLFTLFCPAASKKQFMAFSDIEGAILDDDVDCGVIIHENRFTYASKGLVKIQDLGEFWEQETEMPIPLGAIIARKSIASSIRNDIDSDIKRSVLFALSNPSASAQFVRKHAQEMQEDIMSRHIETYVNNYSC